ncbi:sigma-70 family RNA polymerase sigma factor [Thalassotalea crassostreae]|uniref:sigma-70 family RNA polymerase sigma factor n=1 Tax=Thalassotalea crassostreae TaxID=1763536 RepID=UPI0008389A1A|nr:sigma-70 family RNA polymerase sigma factor [Thalassotalea crassostreae]
MSGTTIDWTAVILTERFFRQLNAMTSKRFVQPALAEEAVTEIIEMLSADNWQRLLSFSGNSKPETFAYSVASRLIEDFSRRKFGRPRPPVWLQDLGTSWVKLWRMLCLERQWPELIEQKLKDDFQPGYIANAIKTIKQRIPRCGEPGFSECCTTELGLEQLPDDSSEQLEQAIANNQRQNALALLSELINSAEQKASSNQQTCPSNANDALAKLAEQININNDDRLLLALSYEDGLSSRKVADLLNISAASVQRKLTSVRQQLHTALIELGLIVESVNGHSE